MGVGFGMFALLILVLFIALITIGLLLIVRGFRGRVDLASPACAKCQYDLRWIKHEEQKNCPECGADLGERRAVHFGRYGRSIPMLVIGALVALSPLVLLIGGALFAATMNQRAVMIGPGGNATKTTAQLINDLATTADEPWTWNELHSRYTLGQLSNEEIAAAIDQLIAHLQAQPAGMRTLPAWSDAFVESAIADDRLTEEQLNRLIEFNPTLGQTE